MFADTLDKGDKAAFWCTYLQDEFVENVDGEELKHLALTATISTNVFIACL